MRRPSRRAFAIAAAIVPLLGVPCGAAHGATVEAYAGEPFGVARVTVGVGGAGPVAPIEDERFTVTTPDGRVLYPVLKEERARRLLRQLLEIDRPRSVTMYFLFRGGDPLDLQIFAPGGQPARVAPAVDAAAHAQLLAEWWQEYGNRWQSLQQDPQFPPVAENFLAVNLARRLGLQLPQRPAGLLAGLAPQKTVWDDLLITERHKLSLDASLLEPAPQTLRAETPEPLPPQLPWYDLPAPDEALAATPVEPLASRVPAECFYVRFGTFTNYLWFRDLNRKWQGDLGNMIVRRGIDPAAAQRIEQQLSLRESALSKIVGPQVIADVAIIGLDPYINQGAAIGMLFQARVTPLLARDLNEKRRESLAKFPDAAETTVRVADRDVSLISTPGGEVRSYYVADADFHLVTTSLRLVHRFLQAGAGERSLATSAGFLHVRRELPHDRADAVFAYLSPEFVRELTSPAVWIEAQRRARSQREVDVRRLARLEAAAEGISATTVEELMAADILPAGFASRWDGSALLESESGPSDSQRGRIGYFVPTGDRDVEGATPTEAAAYRRFCDRFRAEVGQTPPLAVAIQRLPLADGSGETLAADLVATPLEHVKLGRFADMLGEPSSDRVASVPGDVARLELVLESIASPLLGGNDEPHHLFVGVRDFRTPLVVERGRVGPAGRPAELVRMYVGAWPRPGMLRLFAAPEAAEGPQAAPGGAPDTWQARRDDFLLMSFKPDLVDEVLPQLAVAPAPRPAQAWLEVDDLTGKDLAAAINAFGYMRTRETSVAASRLMNTLANQLHAPPDQCRAIAEELVDGTFLCPLGGEYQLEAVADGLPQWTSTAIAPANRFLLTEPPADFQLPLLTWFRGLRGDLVLEKGGRLAAHVEVDMARSATP
ncbi:MAG TPA: hypothetical protein VEQ85_11600 [Lacipirellulaceae bacterium]|nr:hypothetical protein [Lacipirellulaceae bacterium]